MTLVFILSKYAKDLIFNKFPVHMDQRYGKNVSIDKKEPGVWKDLNWRLSEKGVFVGVTSIVTIKLSPSYHIFLNHGSMDSQEPCVYFLE